MGGSSFRPISPSKEGGSSFSGSGAPREMTSKEPCDAFLLTRSSSTSSSRNVLGSSSYDNRRHSQSKAALDVVLRAPRRAATAASARAALSSSKPAAVTPANAPARAAPASLSFAVSLVKRLAALPKGQPSSIFNTSPMASCAARGGAHRHLEDDAAVVARVFESALAVLSRRHEAQLRPAEGGGAEGGRV